MKQRDDIRRLNNGLEAQLKAKGLAFNYPDEQVVPRRALEGRLLQGMARQVRRRGDGPAREVLRQARLTSERPVVTLAADAGGRLASSARAGWTRFDRAHRAARPRFRAAIAGRARGDHPVRRRRLALRLQRAAHLVGRARLDPLPLAGDARRRDRAAPRRAHAADDLHRHDAAAPARAWVETLGIVVVVLFAAMLIAPVVRACRRPVDRHVAGARMARRHSRSRRSASARCCCS